MPELSRLAARTFLRPAWKAACARPDPLPARFRQHRGRRRQRRCLRSKPRKQRQLFARKEAQIQPAEDVIHQALRVADLLVARPARGLEPRVRKLLAQHAQRNAMLQRQRDRSGKCIHQAGDCRTLLRHLDEDLARLSGRIQTHRDVALMPRNRKLMGDGSALCLQPMTHRTWRRIQILHCRLCRPEAGRHLRNRVRPCNLIQRALEGSRSGNYLTSP